MCVEMNFAFPLAKSPRTDRFVVENCLALIRYIIIENLMKQEYTVHNEN